MYVYHTLHRATVIHHVIIGTPISPQKLSVQIQNVHVALSSEYHSICGMFVYAK